MCGRFGYVERDCECFESGEFIKVLQEYGEWMRVSLRKSGIISDGDRERDSERFEKFRNEKFKFKWGRSDI